MSDTKLRGAVGLAMRAGKCVSGTEACLSVVKPGDASLIIIEQTVSENTYKEWARISDLHGIPLILMEDLGAAIGRPGRKTAVITDSGFAKMIKSLYKTDE